MFNLPLQSDAYHMTMGWLIHDPMEIETHVLYNRSGGPQVVADLSQLLERLLASVPTAEQVAQAERYWAEQQIPFPASAWYRFAAMTSLPVTVRGLRDGEVALPGDPIAMITGPAALVGAMEGIIIGDQMAGMQLGTRFIKAMAAVGWQSKRLFEVGLRAVDGPEAHIRKLTRQVRMGLAATSHGEAAQQLGIRAVGTMGHRYTQRYTGSNADYLAFNNAVSRMLEYRLAMGITGVLPLSFLPDTRNTLEKGLPAAVKVIKARWDEIVGALQISIRLDSGDLRAQFRTVIETFQAEFSGSGYMPGIIVESGLTPKDIADFEQIAKEMNFDRSLVAYGLGGYLVGAINRDFVSQVYKLTSFGQRSEPTMKFGDEPASGKESYPGVFELWELQGPGGLTRELALVGEADRYHKRGARPLFQDLVVNGELQAKAIYPVDEVRSYAYGRWQSVTGNYLGDGDDYRGEDGQPRRRPHYSPGLAQLVKQLREDQFAPQLEEVAYG